GARSVNDLLALVRSSHLVISSRYHALVAALANGVPSVALGWSEKYPSLFDDFSVPELAVAMDRPHSRQAAVETVRTALADHSAFRAHLLGAAAGLDASLDSTWERV